MRLSLYHYIIYLGWLDLLLTYMHRTVCPFALLRVILRHSVLPWAAVQPREGWFLSLFPLGPSIVLEGGLVVSVFWSYFCKPEMGDGQEACVLHVQTTSGAVSWYLHRWCLWCWVCAWSPHSLLCPLDEPLGWLGGISSRRYQGGIYLLALGSKFPLHRWQSEGLGLSRSLS